MSQTVRTIADALGAHAEGDLDLEITGVAEPASAEAGHLALAIDKKFEAALGAGAAKAALIGEGMDWQALGLAAAILAPRSRYVMAGVTRVFERPLGLAPGIHPSAVVEPDAVIGEDVWIGPLSYIASGAKVGAGARIMNHVSVGAGASLGAGALLHPQVSIGAGVTIGARFIAQPGATIGGDGFSFVSPTKDRVEEARTTGQISEASRTPGFARINSLGAVTIGDDVEIGANAAIDRGTIADTRIGDGSKLDNLVQLGHNVQIGQHCLLCGQVGIAGSTKVGDRVVLAGQVGVADHIEIGSDVLVGAGSGVGLNLRSGQIYLGYPAYPRDAAMAQFKAVRRLPRWAGRLDALEKAVFKDGPPK